MKESRSKGTTIGHGRTTPGCGAQAGSEGCILDESRSLGSLQKPLLIGGHTWGSEHLKLFHTQQKIGIEAVLAPGTCQLAAHCGAGASGLSANTGIAQTIREPSCTARNTPWAADARADAH